MSATLFRAIARLYFSTMLMILVAIVAIYLVGDFADRTRVFVGKPAADVALLYWYKFLVTLHQLGPAALLLAAGATVSIIRKRGEWTAMRALGMSKWSVSVPIAVIALAMAGALTLFDEKVVTQAGPKIDQLMVERFQRWGDVRFYYFPKQWFRIGNHIFHVKGGGKPTELTDVTIFTLDADFSLTRKIDAESMTLIDASRWRLQHVQSRQFLASGEATSSSNESLEIDLPGTTPETFRVQAGRPELMVLGDLNTQIKIRNNVGLSTVRHELAVHNRFAYPMTGLAASFMVIALSLRHSRKGHLTVALIEGLVVMLLVFTALLVGKSLVLSERIAPSVGAWTPVGALCALALVSSSDMLRRLHKRFGNASIATAKAN